jgi:hypothetical protein
MLLLSKDAGATALAYASGRFTHPDPANGSYINQLGHEFLRGPDRTRRWEELYKLRGGVCETCGEKRLRRQVDLDHEGKTPRTRCDCLNTKLADGTFCTGIALRCTLDPRKGGGPNSCHARKHNREVKSAKVA